MTPGRVIRPANSTQPNESSKPLTSSVIVVCAKTTSFITSRLDPGIRYNVEQVQRDYQTLLSLTFFDKINTRVLTENGPRGGMVVIFEVIELPIIRDLALKV